MMFVPNWSPFFYYIFFEGFIEVNCKHCRGTLFENCEDIAIGSLFKSKNETKEEFLTKAKA